MFIENMTATTAKPLANYLHVYRKKTGLTQREIGLLVGYLKEGAISRHERFHSLPPLLTALAYEAVFGVPVGDIFSGMRELVASNVEERIIELEEVLERANKRDHFPSAVTGRKLKWINERREV
jgi:DNA-binding XRE family transcriptional regulator